MKFPLKSVKFWLLSSVGSLMLVGYVLAHQSEDFWLQIARAYFAQQCELIDYEPQETGETAYHFTCVI